MFRNIIILAAVLLLAAGCSRPAKHAARIDALNQETQSLAQETKALSESVKKLSKSIAALERKTDTLHLRYVQPRLNKEGAKRIDSRLDAIGRRMGVIEMLGSGALSIKVLSGDGDIASAKKLSSMLESAGYEVRVVDFAPSPNSGTLLVFTTDAARPAAGGMVKGLGLKARMRPLTWSTVFDVILVTGKGQDDGNRDSGAGEAGVR